MTGTMFLILLSLIGIQDTLYLSLQEAKRIALQNNRDIQIERKNLEISLGEIMTQKGAFDPALNLGSSYTDARIPTSSTFIPSGAINEEEFIAESGIEGILPTGTFYDLFDFSVTRLETDSPIEDLSPAWFTSLSFTVGQELLRNFGFGPNLTSLIVARKSSEISEKELRERISDVLLNVETAYWNLVAAKESLEVATTAFDLANDLQRRNEIQVEVGVLPPVTVTQAKSEVAARQVDVIRAENDFRAAEDTLKNILTIPLTQPVVPTDEPTTVLKRFDEGEIVEEALKERTEVAQARLDVENRERLKDFFSNQRLPRLAVQGTVNLQGLGGDENPDRMSFGGTPEPIPDQFDEPSDSFRNLFDGEFPTWQVLGVFSLPIFNWTARGNYVKASAELDRSVIAYKRVVDDVKLDVRDAVREVENSLRGIEATRTAAQLAEEVLRNEGERLNVGIGTTRDVLEAQRDLLDARTREIIAITAYNIALARLERARGTILEASGVEIKE